LGEFELPQGSTVALSQYVTHRIPELYPEPQKFAPDRWFATNPAPYAYLPFGAGPRQCVGYPLAMMTLRISLAMILQRYRFTLAPGSRIDRRVGITLSPKYGMPMLISPQDRQFKRSKIRGNIHQMVQLQ
jgi:cytochrome P450